jgi:UDP-2-acetamido-3-amino-2,3-dideoxy-glucuronate N-acetyltransferase
VAATEPCVAVVGCGYWGKNIVRNFAELGALRAVCDEDAAAAGRAAQAFNVPARSYAEILKDRDCTSVAISTPAALHAEHVAAALAAGKHVFVEKPLALSVEAGQELDQAAKRAGRVLMVGHLLHYHPVFVALLKLVREGRLGTIHHVFSNRLNFGKLRTEEDVIWSFAPHDISMILALIAEEPTGISVEAAAITDARIFDIADLHLTFPRGATARVSVSWLNPYKEQKLVVAGSRAYAVFDDTRPWAEKLTLYDHRVEYVAGRPQASPAEGVRVAVEQGEPLRDECRHFLECIANGSQPRTDAAEALRVLAVLESASRAARQATRISISE